MEQWWIYYPIALKYEHLMDVTVGKILTEWGICCCGSNLALKWMIHLILATSYMRNVVIHVTIITCCLTHCDYLLFTNTVGSRKPLLMKVLQHCEISSVTKRWKSGWIRNTCIELEFGLLSGLMQLFFWLNDEPMIEQFKLTIVVMKVDEFKALLVWT